MLPCIFSLQSGVMTREEAKATCLFYFSLAPQLSCLEIAYFQMLVESLGLQPYKCPGLLCLLSNKPARLFLHCCSLSGCSRFVAAFQSSSRGSARELQHSSCSSPQRHTSAPSPLTGIPFPSSSSRPPPCPGFPLSRLLLSAQPSVGAYSLGDPCFLSPTLLSAGLVSGHLLPSCDTGYHSVKMSPKPLGMSH